MNSSRRSFVRLLASSPLAMYFGNTFAEIADATGSPIATGNFEFIYGNETYRNEFYDFLVNVFHLYPQDELDERIQIETAQRRSDQATYVSLQSQLATIKPPLGDLTYALPALNKQKREMVTQTTELLDTDRRYEGYLEIGSTGRYLDALEEQLDIQGERFMVSPLAPTYSIVDMLDRGQILVAGKFIELNDYQTRFADTVAPRSIDLVTVYIGFHHCPPGLRGDFLGAIRDIMKPGGYLIVRDHDARDEKMWRMVALAHDVFNMGTNESWTFNEAEQRHFYSLQTLDDMLRAAGFESDGRRLFQQGDPTLNALMAYRKV